MLVIIVVIFNNYFQHYHTTRSPLCRRNVYHAATMGNVVMGQWVDSYSSAVAVEAGIAKNQFDQVNFDVSFCRSGANT